VNLSQTAKLLGAMAAFDRRTVGDMDVAAWQSVLADIDFDDGLLAVREWYADNTEWMMPAHVRRATERMQQERERAARSTGWAPGQAGVPKDQAMPEISGPVVERLLTRPVRELLRSMGVSLPEGSREALMPRTVAWEREHAAYRRQQEAQPNPHYRPDPTASIVGHRYDADRKGVPCQVILKGLDPANVCGYPESEHAYSAWVAPA